MNNDKAARELIKVARMLVEDDLMEFYSSCPSCLEKLANSGIKMLPMRKTAAKPWSKKPKGWTDKSVKKFWDTLTGDVKHKFTQCVKKMKGNIDDPEGFCAGLKDKIMGTDWRKGSKKKKSSRRNNMNNKKTAKRLIKLAKVLTNKTAYEVLYQTYSKKGYKYLVVWGSKLRNDESLHATLRLSATNLNNAKRDTANWEKMGFKAGYVKGSSNLKIVNNTMIVYTRGVIEVLDKSMESKLLEYFNEYGFDKA